MGNLLVWTSPLLIDVHVYASLVVGALMLFSVYFLFWPIGKQIKIIQGAVDSLFERLTLGGTFTQRLQLGSAGKYLMLWDTYDVRSPGQNG